MGSATVEEYIELLNAEQHVDLQKLRDFARHGVQPQVRGEVWLYLMRVLSDDKGQEMTSVRSKYLEYEHLDKHNPALEKRIRSECSRYYQKRLAARPPLGRSLMQSAPALGPRRPAAAAPTSASSTYPRVRSQGETVAPGGPNGAVVASLDRGPNRVNDGRIHALGGIIGDSGVTAAMDADDPEAAAAAELKRFGRSVENIICAYLNRNSAPPSPPPPPVHAAPSHPTMAATPLTPQSLDMDEATQPSDAPQPLHYDTAGWSNGSSTDDAQARISASHHHHHHHHSHPPHHPHPQYHHHHPLQQHYPSPSSPAIASAPATGPPSASPSPSPPPLASQQQQQPHHHHHHHHYHHHHQQPQHIPPELEASQPPPPPQQPHQGSSSRSRSRAGSTGLTLEASLKARMPREYEWEPELGCEAGVGVVGQAALGGSEGVQGFERALVYLCAPFVQCIRVEAGMYFAFEKLMGLMSEYHAREPVALQVARLVGLVRTMLPELYAYFEEEEVDIVGFGTRWLEHLLAGELRVEDLLRLWDTYFAVADPMDLHVYVCIAILTHCKDSLEELDGSEAKSMLASLPPLDIDRIINEAINIRLSHQQALREEAEGEEELEPALG
ncbi:hypothetical protein ACQY0O_003901 [Thecaphora frezii]